LFIAICYFCEQQFPFITCDKYNADKLLETCRYYILKTIAGNDKRIPPFVILLTTIRIFVTSCRQLAIIWLSEYIGAGKFNRHFLENAKYPQQTALLQ
jgi:hypothetical protein